MAGDMYIAKNIGKSKKYAAIVVGHPFGGVKEQTSGCMRRSLRKWDT